MLRKLVFVLVKALMCLAIFTPFACIGQETVPAHATNKADVSLNVYGFFPTSSLNNGLKQNGSATAGATASVRYSFARYASFEVNYGHAKDTAYFKNAGLNAAVHTGVHEVTGAYVFNLPTYDKFQGFLLAGGGTLQFNPISGGTSIRGTQSQSKPAILLGAGVNYALSPHIALRLQYRSLLYALPSFKVEALRTNGVQAASEPSVGVVYRF